MLPSRSTEPAIDVRDSRCGDRVVSQHGHHGLNRRLGHPTNLVLRSRSSCRNAAALAKRPRPRDPRVVTGVVAETSAGRHGSRSRRRCRTWRFPATAHRDGLASSRRHRCRTASPQLVNAGDRAGDRREGGRRRLHVTPAISSPARGARAANRKDCMTKLPATRTVTGLAGRRPAIRRGLTALTVVAVDDAVEAAIR
jgi:hypothetical protein